MATYSNGSRGTLVASIQNALTTAGFYKSNADGVFGPGTVAAVKAFQTSVGLPADGVVGPTTWNKLFSPAPATSQPTAVAAPTTDQSQSGGIVEEIVSDISKVWNELFSTKPSTIQVASTSISTPVVAPPTIVVAPVVKPAVQSSSTLAKSCLALTGSIETARPAPGCFSSVIGDFDGELLSFGALQWNLGQGTLQPLLRNMINNHSDIVTNIFGSDLSALSNAITSHSAAASFIQSIQINDKEISSSWKSKFEALGATPDFQDIQTTAASSYYNHATELCTQYGLVSKRGRALMFDICVQNGSISVASRQSILSQFESASGEVSKMQIIANVVANHSNPDYADDVRARKLTIANGIGIIHETRFDLSAQFGIDMSNA